MVEQIHKGALAFIDDFIGALGEYRNQISIKPTEVSLPYEGFIRFANSTDLKVFSASFFEDEVWGGANRINIADFIMEQHNEYNVHNNFPNAQIAVNQVVQEDEFIRRVKNKLENHPYLYKVARKVYNTL